MVARRLLERVRLRSLRPAIRASSTATHPHPIDNRLPISDTVVAMPRTEPRRQRADEASLDHASIDEAEASIEARRRIGEGALGELFLLRPNRFSPGRAGSDVLLLGCMTLLLIPVGPVALLRAIRCRDQYQDADLEPPRAATVGAALAVVGTASQLALLCRVFLR